MLFIGSITKAANSLYISQPAVTQAIKNLEDKIGATLFVRAKKGVVLTEEAKVLYNYIETGINYIKNGENKFKELKNIGSGTLRIGASTTITHYVLLPLLEKYQELYPNVNISIVNNLTRDLVKSLREGSLDLLVLNLPTKETKDILVTPFLTVHDYFMVGKRKQNLSKEKKPLKSLENEDFIFQKQPSNTRSFLDNWLAENHVNFIPKYDIVSFNLVKDMTKMGLGIGYITEEFAQDELNKKELFKLDVEPKVRSREVGYATLKNSIPSFATRALIDLIQKEK